MLDLSGVRPCLGAEAGRLRWIETLVDSVRYGSLLVDANPLADFAQQKVVANNPNSGKKSLGGFWKLSWTFFTALVNQELF